MNWISVNDETPKLTEPMMWLNEDCIQEVLFENYKATVLAFDPEKGIIKAELNKRGWCEISSISSSSIVNITHWMPLPEPPKN